MGEKLGLGWEDGVAEGWGRGATVERKRLSVAARSLPFYPIPSAVLCASLGGRPSLPWACLLPLSGRGGASPETQTGKLLGKWGQDWVSPGSAHGAKDPPNSL